MVKSANKRDMHNIIFDLGGVLIDWRPHAILERLYPNDPALRTRIMRDAIKHPDWARLDTGELSEPQAAARFARRTGLPPSAFLTLFDTVRLMLTPVPGTLRILQDLHSRGAHCFCLSNIPESNYTHLRKHYPFFRLFSGITVSYKLGIGKPDLKIFKYTLDTFRLDPAHTVFIDDSARNTGAAQRLGMRTILFHYPGQCRAALAAMGAL
jgi:putative hydrolase of the HAD superfamily